MKKLLLIPTVLMTGFLAFAFVMPAMAASVVRSVAPAVQITVASALSAGSGSVSAAVPASKATAVSGGSSSSSASSSARQPLLSPQGRGHEVSTAGEENCGRFGNGHHGGKHDFACPNRPFPAPGEPISP